MNLPKPPKVVAVLSYPRIGFLDNWQSCNAFSHLGIPVLFPQGAWWDKAMILGFYNAIKMDPKYIITTDYDSIFTEKDIATLVQHMELNPQADLIFGAQIKRESEEHELMFSPYQPKIEKGEPMDPPNFEHELSRSFSGHFGLTIIRTSSLKSLKQPWFWNIPVVGEEKPDTMEICWQAYHSLDGDMYFWQIADEAGWRCYQANRVLLGHLQRIIEYPLPGINGTVNQFLHQWTSTHKKPWEQVQNKDLSEESPKEQAETD